MKAGSKLARYRLKNGKRAFDKWIVPYMKSVVYSRRLRPILSYMFTEWNCNINCHYCFQYDNDRQGMDFSTAKSSIDWLKSIGCRVVALMGGEPLLRREFILDVIRYGSRNGFFMYLPTNGFLMNRDYIDRLGKADVAAINLAVDCVKPKEGLPKALMSIRRQFEYLVAQQEKYGYLLFFNINITSKNLEDVRLLTEIAHENGIGTDYHINQAPLIEQSHYRHMDNGSKLYIMPEQYEEVDKLLDWLIMKNRKGYPMVNSVAHLEAMKDFMRHRPLKWDCRAGHNGIFIKPDGTLSPCFDMQSLEHDWGRIWAPRFSISKLDEIKAGCVENCLSTCFYTMGHYYQPREAVKWIRKHMGLGSAERLR